MTYKTIQRLITTIIALIISSPIGSQELPLKFEQVLPGTDENSNTITKIIQDCQGFLWFGTKKGLIRYDGYQFVQYKYNLNKTAGISGDFIRDFAEDKRGDLWIAIENGGLNQYVRSTDKFESYRYQEEDSTGLPTNDVMAVLPDTNGTVWIGTKKGLCKLDLSTKHVTRIRTMTNGPEPVITGLIMDHKGSLWLATRNLGLFTYDPLSGTICNFIHDPLNPASICDNSLWTVYQDNLRNIWVGSWGKGLDRFDILTGKFVHYRHDPTDLNSISSDNVSSIYEDREQRLWITTYGNGISLLDRFSGKFTRFTHDSDNKSGIGTIYTICIFQDHSGSFWVGTYGAGLIVSFKSWKKIYLYDKILAGQKQAVLGTVNAIHRSSSGITMIGSASHGLAVYDTETNLITPFSALSWRNREAARYSVFCMIEARDRTLWLGTELGLVRADTHKKAFDLFQNPWTDYQHTETICELPDGRLMTNVIDHGPFIFNPETQRFSKISDETGILSRMKGQRVLCHYHDGDSVIWFGTNRSGLYKYQHQSDQLDQFTVTPNDSHSISNNVVMVIHPGSNNSLWIGTEGGLNHFDKRSGRFKVYREEDGLANDIVDGIMDGQDGKLWIITSVAVSCFDPASGTFRNYDHTDGFPEGRFLAKSSLRMADGTLLAGHEQGLVRFHPEELLDNPFPPPVVITGFKKLNRVADLRQNICTAGELELSYKDYLIAFEFAALNFIHPAKNRYAYMMEGFEEQWNYAGKERTAVYTNLNPGAYTFRVKASNNDGLWNESGASVRLIIRPPLWKTWWAFILYGVSMLLILYAGYQWRVRSIRNRNKELALKVEEKTRELKQTQAELIQTGKMASLGEMVAGLSHEINNPVAFVTGNIENVITDIGKLLTTADYDEWIPVLKDIDHSLTSSLHGAKRIADIVKNMRNFSKLDESEYKEIKIHREIDTILDLFFNQLKDIRFERQYEAILHEKAIPCYAAQINQCLRNILINAVQAVREAEKNNLLPAGKGQITIATSVRDHQVQLTISDNGIGIPEKIIDKIFDPFFTTREVGAGKGLGLSEAYGIIHKHNGTISVRSEYTRGTEVQLSIPFRGTN